MVLQAAMEYARNAKFMLVFYMRGELLTILKFEYFLLKIAEEARDAQLPAGVCRRFSQRLCE